MSTHGIPPIDEGEWQAQELALRAARAGDEGSAAAMASGYRLVAQALLSVPESSPPHDFARDVVDHVARHERGFELRSSRILLILFCAAAVFGGAPHAEPLMQALLRIGGEGTPLWALTALACLALSGLGRRWLPSASLRTS